MDYKAEVKKALSENRVIIGSREVLRALKTGKPKFVVISLNCPDPIRKDIEYNAKLAGVDVFVFDGTGRDLGIFCGKPFPIAALAVEG